LAYQIQQQEANKTEHEFINWLRANAHKRTQKRYEGRGAIDALAAQAAAIIHTLEWLNEMH
jgi:hypothetical protein